MLLIIIQSLLVLVGLFLITFYFYLKHKYSYWKQRGVPFEEPNILLGNLGGLMRLSIWDFMYDLSKKHKTDYVGIFLGWKPTLVINSKELAKKVLVKDFHNFENRYTYPADKEDPLGAFNLLTVKNPIWVKLRDELTPVFTSLRLKKLTELMNINSAHLTQRIQVDYIENEKTVNLKELFLMYTSDTVGYTVFGLRVSVLSELTSPLWFITRHMVQWTFWRGFEFTMIFFIPAVAALMRLKFFSAPATAYVKDLFWNVVQQRKKLEMTDDKDLVNHLLKLKDNMKLPAGGDTQLAENLMLAQAAVFIMGAIDTSSTTLCYCVHELAYHPQEQEKLFIEIKTAMKVKNKNVLDFSDLLELTYLTACIKETLRKNAPVAFLDRVCMKKYKLTEELTIEEGTPVFVNMHAIHYNEEYYPEPEEWRPERFDSSPDNDNRDFTFLAFGEGPRCCIGKRYGLMQVRTAIVHMVTKFRFEPDGPYLAETDPYSVVLRPKSGGRVKFIPR